MQAEILVLHYHPPSLDRLRDVDLLGKVERGRDQRTAQLIFGRVGHERDAIDRAYVNAGVALDAQRSRKDGLHIAVETALRFAQSLLQVEPEFDLGLDVLERHRVLDMRNLKPAIERDRVVV